MVSYDLRYKFFQEFGTYAKKTVSPFEWSLDVLSTARGRQNAFLLHFQDMCILVSSQ